MKKLNNAIESATVSVKQSTMKSKAKMQACDLEGHSAKTLLRDKDGAAKKVFQSIVSLVLVVVMISSTLWVPVKCDRAKVAGEGSIAQGRCYAAASSAKKAGARTTSKKKARKKNVKIRYKTKRVKIPYKTRYKTSRGMYVGRRKVLKSGRPGIRKLRYRLTYRNGKLKKKELVKRVVEKEPIARLVEKGTKKEARLPDGKKVKLKKVLVMNASAYSCDGRKGVTASGAIVRVGYIAVDPKVIPLGTKLYIQSMDGTKSYGYAVAKDTGGAIKGNKIDLYFDTTRECIKFGRRDVKVFVLK